MDHVIEHEDPRAAKPRPGVSGRKSGDTGRYSWRSAMAKEEAVSCCANTDWLVMQGKKVPKKKKQSSDDLRCGWVVSFLLLLIHVCLPPVVHYTLSFPFNLFLPVRAFISAKFYQNVCRSACCCLCPPGPSRCYGSRRAQCRCFGQ